MKKIIFTTLIVAFMGMLLWGCKQEDEFVNMSVGIEDKSFTLNGDDYSIYDGRFTYKTMYEENEDGATYTFIYPDKSSWSIYIKKGQDIDTGKREYSEDYGDPRYASGENLYEAYTMLKAQAEDGNGLFNIKITPIKVVFGVIIVAIGVFMIAAPYKIWHIYEGWKFKGEVEPSDTYIGSVAVAGVFLIIVAVVLVLFA